jgi:hypothetical protein
VSKLPGAGCRRQKILPKMEGLQNDVSILIGAVLSPPIIRMSLFIGVYCQKLSGADK